MIYVCWYPESYRTHPNKVETGDILAAHPWNPKVCLRCDRGPWAMTGPYGVAEGCHGYSCGPRYGAEDSYELPSPSLHDPFVHEPWTMEFTWGRVTTHCVYGRRGIATCHEYHCRIMDSHSQGDWGVISRRRRHGAAATSRAYDVLRYMHVSLAGLDAQREARRQSLVPACNYPSMATWLLPGDAQYQPT